MEEPASLGLLLLPVMGGFLLIMFSSRWRFYFNELEGHKLFFASAGLGTLLLGASRLIVLGGHWLDRWLDLNPFRRWAYEFLPTPYSGTLLLSLVLGLLIGIFSNVRMSREKALRKAAEHADGLLGFLLDYVDRRKPVSLNLTNGEFYIGYVVSLHKVGPNPYIRFFPTILCHKSEENGPAIEFFYEENIAALEEALNNPGTNTEEHLESLEIVLKRSEILGAEPAESIMEYLQTKERKHAQRQISPSLAQIVGATVYKWLLGRSTSGQ